MHQDCFIFSAFLTRKPERQIQKEMGRHVFALAAILSTVGTIGRPAGDDPYWSVSCSADAACPDGNTCCKLVQGDFGCCPGPNAVCCPNQRTCCPEGSKCTETGDCASGHGAPGWLRAQKVVTSNTAPKVFPTSSRSRPRRPAGDAVTVYSSSGEGAVNIDERTGEIMSISVALGGFGPRGTFNLTAGGTSLDFSSSVPQSACSAPSEPKVSVESFPGGGARVTRAWGECATVTEDFFPDPSAPDAISWSISVSSGSKTTFGAPINSGFAFEKNGSNLQWWAPWDRLSRNLDAKKEWVDPLLPSDSHTGFWEGQYALGHSESNDFDLVVAPLIAVLDPANKVGFSVQMSPEDAGTAFGDSYLLGKTDGFVWSRQTLRIPPASIDPLKFTAHIVVHEDCWRPALGWNVERYGENWAPVSSDETVDNVDGLGSYGSFPIPELNVTQPPLSDPR